MNASSAAAPRQSTLPTGRERFLSGVVQYALAEGWRTSSDFLRHFGPRILINALANDDALRIRLLIAATRVNERLAARKTPASSAEDLTLALEEGLTDPDALLALFPPDEQVRYLDAGKLWAFLSEVEFWKSSVDDPQDRERYVRRLTFVLECGLREGVLRVQDIADGIGFKRIANSLPRAELQRVVEHALSRAREGQMLTEEQLLEAVPLKALMTHVPLEHTWNEVVLGRLARPLGLAAPVEEPPRSRKLPPPPPSRSKASSKPARFDPALLPESLLELQRGLGLSPASREDHLQDLVTLTSEDSEQTISVELETRVDLKAHRDEEGRQQDEALNELERVTAALRRIGRLPPAEPDLTLPILLSIESMYAELSHTSDDNARYGVIRDAFPNQMHLRVALIGLIQFLAPERAADGNLENAGTDALIRSLLFEEQRLGAAPMGVTHHDPDAPLLRPPAGQFS